jgi:adenylate kinase
MMRLSVMGPPGAGKGTQCAKLAERFHVPHISTGDLFRHHISSRTEMGQRVQKYLNSGEYVPDEITTEMVRKRLDEQDATQGFILDGYPRTTVQVGDLDSMLATKATGLNKVVVVEVPPADLLSRLSKRAREQGRPDDDQEVIRRRAEVYQEQTAPVLNLYKTRGQVVEVSGSGSIEDVFKRILTAVGA